MARYKLSRFPMAAQSCYFGPRVAGLSRQWLRLAIGSDGGGLRQTKRR